MEALIGGESKGYISKESFYAAIKWLVGKDQGESEQRAHSFMRVLVKRLEQEVDLKDGESRVLVQKMIRLLNVVLKCILIGKKKEELKEEEEEDENNAEDEEMQNEEEDEDQIEDDLQEEPLEENLEDEEESEDEF